MLSQTITHYSCTITNMGDHTITSPKCSLIYTWLYTHHYKLECTMIVSICNLSRNKHLHTIITNTITHLNTMTTIHYQQHPDCLHHHKHTMCIHNFHTLKTLYLLEQQAIPGKPGFPSFPQLYLLSLFEPFLHLSLQSQQVLTPTCPSSSGTRGCPSSIRSHQTQVAARCWAQQGAGNPDSGSGGFYFFFPHKLHKHFIKWLHQKHLLSA